MFGHGQLYVALSRATHPDNVKVFVEETTNQGTFDDVDGVYTKNIVYTEMLNAAGIDTNEPLNCTRPKLHTFEYADNHEIVLH